MSAAAASRAADPVAVFERAFVEAFLAEARPKAALTVDEWADRYRILSPETCPEPGKWYTSRVPYLREPMRAISDPLVETIVLKFASQCAKTELLLNAIAYFIAQDPSPIMVAQPREHDARKFSRTRVAPMIRDTAALTSLVAPPKLKDGDNTLLEKLFPGGRLLFVGANAPAGLAGDPIRVFMADEIDRYPASAGNEGDPVSLGIQRTSNYPARKIILTSTPTDESSRIEKAYLTSDQRLLFVPCPACGVFETLKWRQVKWERGASNEHRFSTARYECEACEERWTDAERIAAVAKAEWRASAPFEGVAGFHLNALASPWALLARLAQQWIGAQGHSLLLQTFINTKLAEVFYPRTASVSADRLERRCERYPVAASGEILVPRGVAVLTAGVDVQDDRLEAQIIGYGSYGETWALEYHVLPGDVTKPMVWNELWERVLLPPRVLEDGSQDYVRATAVDSGFQAQAAYAFGVPRHRYRTPDGKRAYVFVTKGYAGPGDLWPRKPTIIPKMKVPLYAIKVDTAKTQLYQMLSARGSHPDEVVARRAQPGVVHFPVLEGAAPYEFGERYFVQLAAEKRVIEPDRRTGAEKVVWKLKHEGARNEALDTFVLSFAALQGLRVMGFDLDAAAAGRLGLPSSDLGESGDSDVEAAIGGLASVLGGSGASSPRAPAIDPTVVASPPPPVAASSRRRPRRRSISPFLGGGGGGRAWRT